MRLADLKNQGCSRKETGRSFPLRGDLRHTRIRGQKRNIRDILIVQTFYPELPEVFMRSFTGSLLVIALIATALMFCEQENYNPVESRQNKEEVVAHDPYCADTIKIFTPEEGAVYHVGDTLRIRYCADSSYRPFVQISFNAGIGFHLLGYGNPFYALDSAAHSETPGVISWVIPDSTYQSTCLVYMQDFEHDSIRAYSTPYFRIVADD